MVAGTPLELLARKVHALFTPKPGADQMAGAENRGRSYDIQTIEVMKRILKKDSNCVDVGCHQGSILREILNIAPEGTHFAFEPLPEMYRHLVETFGNFPGVHIYDCALSDAPGMTSFQYVESNPAYSGFRQRKYDRPDEIIREITVKTELLDRLIPASMPIHFIKIDVEGAEFQVLRGAKDMIRKNQPVIVFEHGLGAADYYGTGPEAIFEILAGECKLKLFILSDWLESNGKQSLSREAFCEQFYSRSHYYFMAAA